MVPGLDEKHFGARDTPAGGKKTHRGRIRAPDLCFFAPPAGVSLAPNAERCAGFAVDAWVGRGCQSLPWMPGFAVDAWVCRVVRLKKKKKDSKAPAGHRRSKKMRESPAGERGEE